MTTHQPEEPDKRFFPNRVVCKACGWFLEHNGVPTARATQPCVPVQVTLRGTP